MPHQLCLMQGSGTPSCGSARFARALARLPRFILQLISRSRLIPIPTGADDLSDFVNSGEEDNGVNAVFARNASSEINGNWLSASSNAIHEARLKAKAKRKLRKNSSRDSGRGDSLSDNGDATRGTSAVPTSPKSKLMDRKSRMGKGRGLPKKGWISVFIIFLFNTFKVRVHR